MTRPRGSCMVLNSVKSTRYPLYHFKRPTPRAMQLPWYSSQYYCIVQPNQLSCLKRIPVNLTIICLFRSFNCAQVAQVLHYFMTSSECPGQSGEGFVFAQMGPKTVAWSPLISLGATTWMKVSPSLPSYRLYRIPFSTTSWFHCWMNWLNSLGLPSASLELRVFPVEIAWIMGAMFSSRCWSSWRLLATGTTANTLAESFYVGPHTRDSASGNSYFLIWRLLFNPFCHPSDHVTCPVPSSSKYCKFVPGGNARSGPVGWVNNGRGVESEVGVISTRPKYKYPMLFQNMATVCIPVVYQSQP